MKVFFRIFKLLAILIISVSIVLFSASIMLHDRIAGIIVKSLNKNLSTKFTIESTRLSFIRDFPNASLEMKNIVVLSSPGFDRSGFEGINTDTLLRAASLRAEFSITDIINGIYTIDKISVMEGHLYLYSDTAGRVNYEISAATTGEENKFTINLDKVNISGIGTTYINLATKLLIKGFVENGRLRTRISGGDLDFAAFGSMQVSLLRLYNFTLENNIDATVNVKLRSTPGGTKFEKSTLELDKYKFGLSGTVSGDGRLDLLLSADNINIADFKKYMPAKYNEKIALYNPSGLLNISSKINGLMTRTVTPRIDIDFSLAAGSATYSRSILTVNDLSFDGFFSNGGERTPGTSSLAIRNFKGTLGSAQFTGNFFLNDFDSLICDLDLTGRLVPAELKEFFNITSISSAAGTIDFSMNMRGPFPRKEKYSLFDFTPLNRRTELKLNSFSIGLNENKFSVADITGKVLISDSVSAGNLKFNYRENKCEFDGTIRNLPEWLSGKSVLLKVAGDAYLEKIMPESFFAYQENKEVKVDGQKAYDLPKDITLDIRYRIGEFVFKSFSAEEISGTLDYRPGIVNIKTLRLKSLEGLISGSGFLIQNPDKSFIARGSFKLENVNVRKTFESFKNFGQDFIKSENLEGSLSGSLSVLIPTDSLLKPVVKMISSEGKYILENGALIDFDPVKELSSFIELSELENIHFERLENDFFIRNNSLFLPQMDVKSSAADLSVSGKHSFDNDYEYHVRILLSEMLSRKIRKPKPNTTEFGVVKDDGLGRTSMLLRIFNRGEEVRVAYDMKAAGSQIKNDIKAERQNLKTILNQEYGMFKKDTVASGTKSTGNPRFRITWDETDTVKTNDVPPPVPKENPLKNLFRKKKIN